MGELQATGLEISELLGCTGLAGTASPQTTDDVGAGEHVMVS